MSRFHVNCDTLSPTHRLNLMRQFVFMGSFLIKIYSYTSFMWRKFDVYISVSSVQEAVHRHRFRAHRHANKAATHFPS